VLFTNDKTLFNFLVPDVVRGQLSDLDELFRGWFECILSDEGFDSELKVKVLSEYQETGYASSNSKTVLGSMNDLAFHYNYLLLEGGGVHSCDLPEIIRNLNRMPLGVLGYEYSIVALKTLFGVITEARTV
jgi:hypothetical protein